MPFYNYPWVVIYRKSVFTEKGYTVPKTWDEFMTLAKKMQADGLTPLAFADKDGWPAMGTFDIINMRVNGYQFHVDLMAGKQKWTDPKVAAVFQKWAELLPFNVQPAALGRTWQDAANTARPEEGRDVLPGHLRRPSRPPRTADLDDLDFFPFPTLGTEFDAELGIDAPIDALHDDRQVAEPRGRQGRRARLSRVPRHGPCPDDVPRRQTRTASLLRTTRTRAATRPSRRSPPRSSRGPKAIAQFLDRDTARASPEADAEPPPELARRTRPGHGRIPQEHPGLLGLARHLLTARS